MIVINIYILIYEAQWIGFEQKIETGFSIDFPMKIMGLSGFNVPFNESKQHLLQIQVSTYSNMISHVSMLVSTMFVDFSTGHSDPHHPRRRQLMALSGWIPITD